MSCHSDPAQQGAGVDIKASAHRAPLYAWTDITYLLHAEGISWAYFVAPGTCLEGYCGAHNHGTPRAMNPLIGYLDVHQDGQVGNIRTHQALFRDASSGQLPQVSWVIPGRGFSEHPNAGTLATGQAFVTKVINAIGKGPAWGSSAIFLTWDDWGGFYDHVKPPRVDGPGTGCECPGC